jgi:hypothetical protein
VLTFLPRIYTFSVYASSAIYVSSEGGIMAHFGVQDFKASLGLALFVLGYGIGKWSIYKLNHSRHGTNNFAQDLSYSLL